ncbi:uncharacterized protein F5Z01DRAFT_670483 [Emericellopsis atlantica]|uniref:Uncharacterized protein n=1 Tax=Emericellopsis atlantica TaxID=2614577 RepID=A0A9P7ZUE7_9HYPO|nr:uncharacterized protein F5Z01DRAFT_670483 [Emericellopsis atlantica]KAG9257823.1 hypothetical protein F5Z01DRAFT_670483 [Emericellopsis atlantica]
MASEKEKEITPGQDHGHLRSVASLFAYPFQSTRVTKEAPSPADTSEDTTPEEGAQKGLREEKVDDDWILLTEGMDAVVVCGTAAAAAARDTPAEPTGAPETTSRAAQHVAKQIADFQEKRHYKTASKKSKGKQPATVASSSASVPPPPPPPVDGPRARLPPEDRRRMEILEKLTENRRRVRAGVPLDDLPRDTTTTRSHVDYMSTTEAPPSQPMYSAEVSYAAGPAMGYGAYPSGQSDAYLFDPALYCRPSNYPSSNARDPNEGFSPVYMYTEAYKRDQDTLLPYGPAADEPSSHYPYYQ